MIFASGNKQLFIFDEKGIVLGGIYSEETILYHKLYYSDRVHEQCYFVILTKNNL